MGTGRYSCHVIKPKGGFYNDTETVKCVKGEDMVVDLRQKAPIDKGMVGLPRREIRKGIETQKKNSQADTMIAIQGK